VWLGKLLNEYKRSHFIFYDKQIALDAEYYQQWPLLCYTKRRLVKKQMALTNGCFYIMLLYYAICTFHAVQECEDEN